MLTFSCLHSHNSNPIYFEYTPKVSSQRLMVLPHPKEKQSGVVKTKQTLSAKSNVTSVTQASTTETAQNPLPSVPQKEQTPRITRGCFSIATQNASITDSMFGCFPWMRCSPSGSEWQRHL